MKAAPQGQADQPPHSAQRNGRRGPRQNGTAVVQEEDCIDRPRIRLSRWYGRSSGLMRISPMHFPGAEQGRLRERLALRPRQVSEQADHEDQANQCSSFSHSIVTLHTSVSVVSFSSPQSLNKFLVVKFFFWFRKVEKYPDLRQSRVRFRSPAPHFGQPLHGPQSISPGVSEQLCCLF